MPPPTLSPGPDDLVIPAFMVTDDNAADLERWKQEHPDWFHAGYWKPPRRRARPPYTRFGGAGRGSVRPPTPGTVQPPTDYAALTGPLPLMDPSTLSVRDFEAAAASAGSGASSGSLATPVQHRHGAETGVVGPEKGNGMASL